VSKALEREGSKPAPRHNLPMGAVLVMIAVQLLALFGGLHYLRTCRRKQ
jgi:hypothetical protein